ncbi:uncharacterized protein LOC132586826 [Heteronotia binoei]|uniref:uncharacterized protein LOC132586826 n=1 Tax=Heteronotia binoei TaxID=13085 RepID=UPI00292CD217|nr:uncharacterized protein LOC132586826 [Heteronotia binoei]
MERKEQRSGSPGRKSGRGGGRGGGPGEAEAVVQRTQVVLLAGESWEPDSAQAVLSSFAHHVLPPAAADSPCSPSLDDRAVVPAATAGEPSSPQPPSAPPPAQGSGQLTFFLCRPSSLRERLPRLREVLQGVREQSRGTTSVLVGVIVQPREDEEAEARQRLGDLLCEVFQAEGAVPVEVHTAIFKPGRPEGALEVKRVAGSMSPTARRISGSKMWLDKSKVMQIFGAMLSAGTVAYGSYYFYHNRPE